VTDHPTARLTSVSIDSRRFSSILERSAKQGQITTVIQKKTAAKQQRTGHLKSGSRVSRWLWVASGNVQYADTNKARRRLDEAGLATGWHSALARLPC